jgi:hypothetical protein
MEKPWGKFATCDLLCRFTLCKHPLLGKFKNKNMQQRAQGVHVPTHRSFTNKGHELQIWVVGPYLSTKRVDQISGQVLKHEFTHDPTHDLAQPSSSILSREPDSPPVPPEATVDHLSDFLKLSLSPCICPVLFEDAPHEIILDHVSPLYGLDELPPVALAHARNALAVFERLASPRLKQTLRFVGCFVGLLDVHQPHVIYSVAGALQTLPGHSVVNSVVHSVPLLMFTSAPSAPGPHSPLPRSTLPHSPLPMIALPMIALPMIALGSAANSLKNPPVGFPWMLE